MASNLGCYFALFAVCLWAVIVAMATAEEDHSGAPVSTGDFRKQSLSVHLLMKRRAGADAVAQEPISVPAGAIYGRRRGSRRLGKGKRKGGKGRRKGNKINGEGKAVLAKCVHHVSQLDCACDMRYEKFRYTTRKHKFYLMC